jgi:hypothetical protein
MTRLEKFLTILSLTLLTGCSFFKPEERIVVKTELVTRNIPLQERPRPPVLTDVQFSVVTQENLNDFLERNRKEFGNIVFFAISVRDYENLSLNVGELRRYLNQQKAIIVYYEKNIQQPSVEE